MVRIHAQHIHTLILILSFYFYFWSKRIVRIRSPSNRVKKKKKKIRRVVFSVNVQSATLNQTKRVPFFFFTRFDGEEKSSFGFEFEQKIQTNSHSVDIKYAFYFHPAENNIERYFLFYVLTNISAWEKKKKKQPIESS